MIPLFLYYPAVRTPSLLKPQAGHARTSNCFNSDGISGKALTTLIDAPWEWKVSQCFWIQSIINGGTLGPLGGTSPSEPITLTRNQGDVKDFF